MVVCTGSMVVCTGSMRVCTGSVRVCTGSMRVFNGSWACEVMIGCRAFYIRLTDMATSFAPLSSPVQSTTYDRHCSSIRPTDVLACTNEKTSNPKHCGGSGLRRSLGAARGRRGSLSICLHSLFASFTRLSCHTTYSTCWIHVVFS